MLTVNKMVKLTFLLIILVMVSACTHHSKINHEYVVPGCNAGTEVIQIKLDTATNTPALVDGDQSTVCVVAGGKIQWTLVQTTGPSKEFTIYFKDGSYSETTTTGNLVFDRTSAEISVDTDVNTGVKSNIKAGVKTIEAYSYGISMPGANDFDPIIIIVPEFMF